MVAREKNDLNWNRENSNYTSEKNFLSAQIAKKVDCLEMVR